MTFEYRDRTGDTLHARPVLSSDGPGITVEVNLSIPVHVPSDRVEEVVAGIRDANRQAAGQTVAAAVVTPEEGVEEARKAIQHVLQIFLDRVPRDELEADIMADSIADALSDELEDVYGRLARAEAALAVVEQPAEAHPPLTAADRKFLHFALDEAADEMSLGDGSTDEDEAALAKLRRMAGKDER